MRKPDGVVGLAPPRNAAASCSVLGLLALVAGNTVVVKAPRSAPCGVSWVWREVIIPCSRGSSAGRSSTSCAVNRNGSSASGSQPRHRRHHVLRQQQRGLASSAACVATGRSRCSSWPETTESWCGRTRRSTCRPRSRRVLLRVDPDLHGAEVRSRPPRVADEFLACWPTRWRRSGRASRRTRVLLAPVLKTQEFGEVFGDALAGGATLLPGGSGPTTGGSRTGPGSSFSRLSLRCRRSATARQASGRCGRRRSSPCCRSWCPAGRHDLLDNA